MSCASYYLCFHVSIYDNVKKIHKLNEKSISFYSDYNVDELES